MEIQKLKQAHEEVKNHTFRLNKEDWEGYYLLLKKLDKEFSDVLEKKFKDSGFNWSFFIHELRSAIFHFCFEFSEEEKGEYRGRLSIKPEKAINKKEKERYEKAKYGVIVPEYQSKIIIILENYIQQIHKFIIKGMWEEFITYYMGGDNCMEDIQTNGKSRWNKYQLNKDTNKFEWVGKLK